MTSINTNASATTALRTLQATSKALETTQNRVATGLKIGEAKDNAAYWAISTTLKSDNKSLSTVKDALNLGAATVDTAYEGLNKTIEVLDEIKAKLTAASTEAVDRTIIQAEIEELQKQLVSIASSSVFSGENWLSVDTTATDYDATKLLVSGFTRDSDNVVTIGTIAVDTSDVVLFDSGAKTGILDSAQSLGLAYGGTTTNTAPATQGLDNTVAVPGYAAGAAEVATFDFGTYAAAGLDVNDQLQFELSVDGSATKTVTVGLSTVTDATSLAAAVETAITTAFGSNVADAINTSGVISIASKTTGTSSTVSLSGLTAVDGDGTVSSAQVSAGGAFGAATAATAAYTIDVSTALTGDTFSFEFQYGSETYTSGTISNTTGETEATLVAKLNTAIAAATKVSDGTAFTGTLTASTTGANNITLTTGAKGAAAYTKILTVTATSGGTTTDATDAHYGFSASTAFGQVNAVAGTLVQGTGSAAAASLTYTASGYDAGDTLSVDVTLYEGGVANAKTLTFATSSTVGGTFANLNAAFIDAYGTGKVVFSSSGATNITATTTELGTGAGIVFGGFTATDGDGTTTSVLGLSTSALSDTGRALTTTATAATVTSNSTFAAATFDSDDTLTFDVTIDSGTAVTVTIDYATINTALGITSGVIADSDEFVTVVNAALAAAGIDDDVIATESSDKLVLSAVTAGASTLTVGNVVSSAGTNTISVEDIDLTSTDFLALTEAQKKEVIKAYISIVSDAVISVTSAASTLGSASSRVELQQSFVDTIIDTIEQGVSNLIDADLSEESTRLQALQTKQQLGIQALSIANASTQNVLALFQ